MDPDSGSPLVGARFGSSARRRPTWRAVHLSDAETDAFPAVPPDVPAVTDVRTSAAHADRYDEPEVGHTGARFGGSTRRRRRAARLRPVAAVPIPAEPPAGPLAEPPAEPPAGPPHRADAPEPPSPEQPSRLSVRPYVLTGGRTRSQVVLAIETLVSTAPGTRPDAGEHYELLELCRVPRSVAEVAALRRIPLGVARVLLGDLAAAGEVTVHATAGPAGPDLALMQRVLTGLRRL